MAKLVCKGENAAGRQCRAYAGESGYCFMHDAARGRERAIARRNGGLSTKRPHAADASFVPTRVRNIEGVFAVLDYALQELIVFASMV